MKKPKIKVLVVDRPLEPEELIDGKFFRSYQCEYDIIVSLTNKKITEIIFFNGQLISQLEKIFRSLISEEFFLFYLINLNSMEENIFFDTMSEKFKIIEKSSLTSLEKEEKEFSESFQKAIM